MVAVPYTMEPQNPIIHFGEDHSEVKLEGEEIRFIGDMDMLVKIGIDILSQNIEELMEDMSEGREYEEEDNGIGVKT